MEDITNIGFKDFDDEGFDFGIKKVMPFTVPDNYFESLEASIINRIEAMEELEEFAVLSTVNREMPFMVPENYFAKEENALEFAMELEGLKVLSGIKKPQWGPLTEEFAVALENNVVRKVELADEIRDCKTLYALDKESGFVTPVDYFENVTDTIKEAVHASGKKGPSIIETILVYVLRPRMAAAFGIVLLLGISAVYYFNQGTVIVDSRCKTLACLEKNELLNEKNIRDFDDDNLIEAVDVDRLNEQIEKAVGKDSTKTTHGE
jgi:hypothetical protein